MTNLKLVEKLTLLLFFFTFFTLLYLSYNSNSNPLSIDHKEEVQIRLQVKKGSEVVWQGRVKKDISTEELLFQIKIDPSRAIKKDRGRILSRSGSVVHIKG